LGKSPPLQTTTPGLAALKVPMRLPIPDSDEVRNFQILYKERFGVTLTNDEALDTATRLVQLVCLLNDAIYPLRQEK
jgi:hypothetical protein